jgi:flagellin-like protein
MRGKHTAIKHSLLTIKKSLFAEERAVSPVIGVIMMVAVTVILAAVIGAFVFGLGGQQQQAPQAMFDFDFNEGEVTISHDSGDALTRANIDVVIDGSAVGESALSSAGSDNRYTAGEGIYSGSVETGDEIRVIWRSPSSDTTTTLSTITVP